MLQLRVLLRVEGYIDGKSDISVMLFQERDQFVLTCLVVINPVLAGLLKELFEGFATIRKE